MRCMKSSGYGVLSLLVMDVFVKLWHGYALGNGLLVRQSLGYGVCFKNDTPYSGIGGGGDGVLKVKSSGVIGERVRVMSIVDGVLDGALGAFGDRGCFGDEVLASSCVRSMNNLLGGRKVILVS
ncbi:hypothetical protein Tco_0393407 [Tanacetum coccineum]